MGFVEIEEKLTEMMRLALEVIDELYILAAQHVDPDDLLELPCMDKIERIVELQKSIEKEGGPENG